MKDVGAQDKGMGLSGTQHLPFRHPSSPGPRLTLASLPLPLPAYTPASM